MRKQSHESHLNQALVCTSRFNTCKQLTRETLHATARHRIPTTARRKKGTHRQGLNISKKEEPVSRERCKISFGQIPSPGVGFSPRHYRHVRPCNHSKAQVDEHAPQVTQAIQREVASQSQPSQLSVGQTRSQQITIVIVLALHPKLDWMCSGSQDPRSRRCLTAPEAEVSPIAGKGCEGKH